MYKNKKLKNGLTILKVPIRGAKSVLVDVFVKTGSRSEEKKVGGISHFLEHLFFKGSQKYPTAQDLSHALDAIGAEYNANTGKEHTQYYVKAAAKHLEFIFTALSDVLQNPVFAKEEIERERGVIIEEINMYEDSPMQHVDDVLEETMWPGHPLGRNIAGTKKSVRGIGRGDIVRYKEQHYRPSNMILAVVGNYSDKALDRLIKKHWSGLADRKTPKWKKTTKSMKSRKEQLERKSTEQYHFSIGFKSFDYDHPDNTAQLVLGAILGGGMSSRLFTEIRERRGLAYYVRAGSGNYQDTGNFIIKAGVRVDALSQALEVVSEELRKIKSDKVGDLEMTKAKEYLKGTLTLSLESSENLLGWYLSQVAFRKKVFKPEDLFRKVDRVKAQDVLRVARQIFRPSSVSVVAVGPKKQKLKLKL